MVSRVIRVIGFLSANSQLAVPFHSRLRVRHEQTDRQTDRQTDDDNQCMTQPMGRDVNTVECVNNVVRNISTLCALFPELR